MTVRDDATRYGRPEAAERSADPLELSSLQLFQRIRDAAIIADVETGRILLWNPAAEDLLGYNRGEAIGLSVDVLVPERLCALHQAGFARYRQTGQGPFIDADKPIEVPALRRTGEEVVVELTLSSLEEAPTGRRLVLAIIRDITARKRAEVAEHLLAEVGKALTSSLHFETMFDNVASLCVPALGDWCAVDIIEPDRSIRRLAVASTDPAKTGLACELENSPPQVLWTGEPRLYEE
ncbi:MAG TPA: PAS domain S-box protein, partial [Dehalococcoidia bacterium]|nr:PAS domain S-box protein [Dehalococcoidia bacterium]